jgi:two-component system osmolarity sensor histidine kinase EnvZ
MSDAARPDLPAQPAAAPRGTRPGWLSLRALAPRGLLGRTLLIVLIPLVILQAVALRIFYGSHLDVISRRLASGLAGDVGMVVELLNRFPAADDRAWIFREAAWRLDLGFAFEPGGRLAQQDPRPASLPLLPLEEDLADALAERVRLPVDADWTTDPRRIFIRVQLPDGVLHVEANRKRLFTGTLYLFVIWLVGSSVLLFGLAALFLKNQVKAVRRLASAAEEFGMGRDSGPI